MIDYTKIFSQSLDWSENDGIIENKYKKTVQTAFSKNAQDELYLLEDDSWWFKYRAKCIYNLLKSNITEQTTLFDVGGGNGYTTDFLQRCKYEVALLEPSLGACLNAKKRGIENIICGTLSEEDINEGSLENILLLDVLEHIENDNEFLGLIFKKLKSNGNLLITVPAMPSLWSNEDERAGHYRRYNKHELKKKIENVGFTGLYFNYFFSFLVVPIWVVRKKLCKLKNILQQPQKEGLEKREFVTASGLVNFALRMIECIEMLLLKHNIPIMCGSSIILLVKKP